MWKDKLKKIQEICYAHSFSDNGIKNPGVPAEIARRWALSVRKTFGTQPPAEVMDFLKYTNGFEWNGHILYGVDRNFFPSEPEYSLCGLIEENEIWHEVEGQDAYLFLGDSNISWYVYEISTGRYMELDKPSGSEVRVFDSFNEMLEHFFDKAE